MLLAKLRHHLALTRNRTAHRCKPEQFPLTGDLQDTPCNQRPSESKRHHQRPAGIAQHMPHRAGTRLFLWRNGLELAQTSAPEPGATSMFGTHQRHVGITRTSASLGLKMDRHLVLIDLLSRPDHGQSSYCLISSPAWHRSGASQ